MASNSVASRPRLAAGRDLGASRHGPRFGSDRVCPADERSTNRASTSRVAARMVTGAMPLAGQGRFATTPNGMWCAVRAASVSHRSGSNRSGWS